MPPVNSIAIIGSGMAGLAAARALTAAGLAVTVFDKGRNPGGRLATRRVDNWIFNHGCQFFTIRDPAFAAAVQPVSAPWALAGPEKFAGFPDMSAVARHLATGLDIRQSAHVRHIARHGHTWSLRLDNGGEHHADALILAIPAPQAAALLAGAQPDIESRLAGIQLSPCWAVMLGFAAPPPSSALEIAMHVPAWPDGLWAAMAGDADQPIAWAARENTRPHATEAPPAFTFHFSRAWSAQHLDDDPQDVIAAALQHGWNFGAHTPAYAAAHRWRYALVEKPLGEPCLWDPATNLGLCGDWCLAPRLEAAFVSGRALARTILA